MAPLLQKSKCSIFQNIFKYMIFQRCQKALIWSKGLCYIVTNCSEDSTSQERVVVNIMYVIQHTHANSISLSFSEKLGLDIPNLAFEPAHKKMVVPVPI